MQYGIGRTTHRDIQRHGVQECLTRGNVTGQHTLITILIIGQRILHNLAGSLTEEFDAVGMCGKNRSVARQRQSNSLCQRVHAVSGKHARARTTARTRTALDFLHLFVRDGRVGTFHHGSNQVGILTAPATSLHRTSATENGGNIQTHGSHQHAWGHLVAVGDANHRIGLMGIDHIFYRVSNDVA